MMAMWGANPHPFKPNARQRGIEKRLSHQPHELKIRGSNPRPAPTYSDRKMVPMWVPCGFNSRAEYQSAIVRVKYSIQKELVLFLL